MRCPIGGLNINQLDIIPNFNFKIFFLNLNILRFSKGDKNIAQKILSF